MGQVVCLGFLEFWYMKQWPTVQTLNVAPEQRNPSPVSAEVKTAARECVAVLGKQCVCKCRGHCWKLAWKGIGHIQPQLDWMEGAH